MRRVTSCLAALHLRGKQEWGGQAGGEGQHSVCQCKVSDEHQGGSSSGFLIESYVEWFFLQSY